MWHRRGKTALMDSGSIVVFERSYSIDGTKTRDRYFEYEYHLYHLSSRDTWPNKPVIVAAQGAP
jgi:hypothetical protein